jgi:hypothetical protein
MKDASDKQVTGQTALEAQRAAARRTAWILAALALAVFAGFIAFQGFAR